MVHLVFEHMPDNPLPRLRRDELPLCFTQEGRGGEPLSQIGGSPAGKGVGNHVPGLLQPADQFSGLVRSLLIGVPGDQTGISFTQPPLELKDA